MKTRYLAAALIALSPVIAAGQAPTSSETKAEGDTVRSVRPRLLSPPERDWEDAATFMREHAPNRWQAIQSLPDDGPLRRSVMAFVVARYRSLLEVRRDDPKLYDIKLSQLAAEDDIYGMIAVLSTPEDREKHRDQLRQEVRRLLELNLTERERRVERLKQTLATEESKVAYDQSHLDAQVNSRLDALVSEGTTALRKEMFPNRPAQLRREGKAAEAATKPAAP